VPLNEFAEEGSIIIFIIPAGKLRKRELICLKSNFLPAETALIS